MSQTDLFAADERPPTRRKPRPSTEHTTPVRLTGTWKHDGVEYHEGDVVDVPNDVLARQPWLSEVGQNALDVMPGALRGIGIRDRASLQKLDAHCRENGRGRYGVIDSLEMAGLSDDPEKLRRLLSGAASPSLMCATRVEALAHTRVMRAIKERNRGLPTREV